MVVSCQQYCATDVHCTALGWPLVTWRAPARWLGHGTMAILTVHGCGFYLLWLVEHDWLRGLVWDRNGTNMLAGEHLSILPT